MTIAARLAVLFAILSFVPLSISGVLMYYRFFDTQQQSAIRSLRTLAEHKRARFEHWIDDHVRLIREIANRPTLRDYTRMFMEYERTARRQKQYKDLLRSEHLLPLLDGDRGFRELFLLNARNGRKFVSSRPLNEDRFYDKEAYFLQGLEHTWFQSPHYPLSLEDVAMTVSTPIRSDTGAVIAVLGGHLDLSAITQIMQQGFDESTSLDSYLVNRFSFFVTRARFVDQSALRRVIHSEGIDRCLAGESAEGIYTDYRGVRVVGAFMWLPRRDVCLMVERDVSDAMQPVDRFRDFMLILFAGVASVVAALIWFVSRQVSRPIIDVVDATERIGRGDLDVRLPQRADGEMARLFHGVNQMAKNLGTLTTSRDELDREVEARRRALHSLQESERRRDILMSNLPGMAYRCENTPEWTMRFVSEGCQELTGFEPEALVNNRDVAYADLIHPGDRARVWTRIQEAVRDARAFELEYRLRYADGTWRWVWEKGRSVGAPQDSPPLLEGFIHDITERQRLARELQQAQKMELLGQVTGGVAHDFNNLLGVILGYTALARKNPGDTVNVTRYLEHVSHAGERARDIVAQMLAFSRGDSGTDEVIDIAGRVAVEIDMLRSTMPATIHLSVNLDHNVPGVELQPGQLNQVLMNLCINARDAMDGRGTLSIRLSLRNTFAGQCSVTLRPFDGDFVELEVADTGPGIDPEAVEKIFDPFYTTKSVGKGSGLGLAVVDGIVRGHGGHIIVENLPGGGAAFRLYFPVSDDRVGEMRDADTSRPSGTYGAGHRILIVDDEIGLAEFLAEYLQSFDFSTSVVPSAEQALSTFLEDPSAFDLVVTDQTMPGMSGLELVDELRAAYPNLPIILCTGFSEFINAEGARERGIGYLAKPINPDTLLDLIAQRLSTRGMSDGSS